MCVLSKEGTLLGRGVGLLVRLSLRLVGLTVLVFSLVLKNRFLLF